LQFGGEGGGGGKSIVSPGGPTGKRPEKWWKLESWWYRFVNFCIVKGPNEMSLMMSNHGDRDPLKATRVQFFIAPAGKEQEACGMLCQIKGLTHSEFLHGWEITGSALINGTGDIDAAVDFHATYNHQTRIGTLIFM